MLPLHLAASSSSASPTASKVEAAALDWCWSKVKRGIEQQGLEVVECQSAEQLRGLSAFYGIGGPGGVAVLRKTIESAEVAKTLDELEEALLPSFPTASKDPRAVVGGGVYMRAVQLAHLMQAIDAIDAYIKREANSSILKRTTRLILADKERAFRRLNAVIMQYIGMTRKSLPFRIETDEKRARDDRRNFTL